MTLQHQQAKAQTLVDTKTRMTPGMIRQREIRHELRERKYKMNHFGTQNLELEGKNISLMA